MTGPISDQKSILLITTKGAETNLDSSTNTDFRKSSRKEGVVLQVVKNTLINKAFPEVPKLTGQTYIAYLEQEIESDEVKVPKTTIGLLSKDFKEYFEVIGAVVNGEFYDKTKAIQLSKTPSYQDSMSMIAGSLNQVATKLAMSIKEIPSGVARGISEVQKNKS